MARGLSRAERQIARRDGQIKALEDKNKILETSVQEKAKLMREYKGAMRSKLRKIKKVLWTKAQGSNKKWLRESLKKCHATEVDIHNKWVSGSQKGKMNLELCRRAGKVALKMEQNKCARVKTRAALAERSSNVALSMCKRSSKRLDTRAALATTFATKHPNHAIDIRRFLGAGVIFSVNVAKLVNVETFLLFSCVYRCGPSPPC